MLQLDPQLWAQFSELRPQLRPHLSFSSHVYRGETWHIIADPLGAQNFRCPRSVFRFLQRLNGSTRVGEAYQVLQQEEGEAAPSQAEVVQLLANLIEKDLLQGDVPVSAMDLYQRHDQFKRRSGFQRWGRPLSVKFSLLDPDQLLEKLRPYCGFVFSAAFFRLMLLVICLGSVIAYSHWGELVEHWAVRFMNPQNLLLLWLLYPLVKGLHELGHAIAIKHWGGEVHDMGVLFLVFIPVPYVDASSSHQFVSKQQRMLVAAAGILVELCLASLALLVWLNTEAGWLSDMAFNIALVGGLSTVFVNGNPLLRFDGYYVLADAIEMPNLYSRSNRYLAYWSKRLLLGLPDLSSPVSGRGEARWLAVYGLAAGAYKLLISFSIAFFVASKFFVVGVLLACWFLLQQLLWPAVKSLLSLAELARKNHKQMRLLVVTAGFASLLGLVLWLPVKSSTHLEGVISLPENASVRVHEEGLVSVVAVRDGAYVKAGQMLVMLENPELATQLEVMRFQQAELEARIAEASQRDKVDTQILKEALAQTDSEIEALEARLSNLKLYSSQAGVVTYSKVHDLNGRYFKKGELLASVVNTERVKISVLIPESKLAALKEAHSHVEVKMLSMPQLSLTGTLGMAVPSATKALPSAMLGSLGGGDIMVDARDTKGLTAIDNVYRLEVWLDDYPLSFLAGRVDLLVRSPPQSLAGFAYRGFRRMLLREFDI